MRAFGGPNRPDQAFQSGAICSAAKIHTSTNDETTIYRFS